MEMALLKTNAFIDGAWIAGKKTFDVTNPADGSLIASVADCGAEETKNAIAAATAAFPAWKALLPKERADILKKWFDLMTAHTDALATLLSKEQGKPFTEAKGEIAYGASFVEWFAQEALRIYGRNVPTFKKGARVMVTHEPIGVCAAITPWNFPNSMITRKVAPALAAGCTIILKPAAETPLSALALAMLAEQAGFPKGVFNIVTSSTAKTIGETLCADPCVRKLSFTGSTEVGRVLMQQCAPTLKRLSMELGGNAPFIVFDDADIDAAVAGAISSKFRNAGQTCVCANRIYVQKKIHDAFISKLKDAVTKLKVGSAFENDVAIGPLINEDALEKVKDLITDATSKGAKIICGGRLHEKGGLFFEPTILDDATKDMRLCSEEIFGPVAPIFTFDTEEQAIQMANAVEYGLAAYFYTKDLGRAFRVSEGLEYGMVGVNEGQVSNTVAPFGGVKQSGFGREGGTEGIEEYTSVKYTLMGGL